MSSVLALVNHVTPVIGVPEGPRGPGDHRGHCR
jgi:hypothetical protein